MAAREVEAARRFDRGVATGHYLELRYEDLVADPEGRLREVCELLGFEFDRAMLGYHLEAEAGTLQDHPRLAEPPTPGLRHWREQMSGRDAECFQAIAGGLLDDFGYERAHSAPSALARARALLNRALLATRIRLWDAALALVRRSPVWRLRQAYVRRTLEEGTSP